MLAYPRVARRRRVSTSQAPKNRDAVISFECSSGAVKIIEAVGGESIQTLTALQELDVVSDLEEKYIFFADEADIARKLIRRGRSFVISVYFREP
jgi:hypothetical protein